ncbi:hypothetical protein IOC44_07700 [Vibrio vulnificus]|uniref:hypothetical protein n=1 Tax=Vibrio vulnificus TaxID=672 RepID=UPI001E2EEFDF|nr:hypothetical protein [Vibrio vulnificus]MCD1409453.1 hypothetical protein [Vibrio vulnificus]MCD1418530.1 hypothetical protein [Vibrio vulnificus]MCD1422962.1 hypothetical protein [Vibrio vulnificus]MCD1437977.1 hypothetical protein [Vibrio vulnificus]MCD1442517.1 hypothetical protein [Vibrio vulnificus]
MEDFGARLLKIRKNIVQKLLAFVVIFILFPLALYGLYVDFIPTHATSSVAKALSILLTLVVYVSGFRVISKHRGLRPINSVFMLLIIGYALHICFSYSIPGLHARIFGKVHGNVQIVEPRKNYASRECDFVVENKYIEPTLHGYICVSEHSYNTKYQVYILTGFQTSLGFYVKHAIPNSIFKHINQKILEDDEGL